jgi:hypothetical protein
MTHFPPEWNGASRARCRPVLHKHLPDKLLSMQLQKCMSATYLLHEEMNAQWKRWQRPRTAVQNVSSQIRRLRVQLRDETVDFLPSCSFLRSQAKVTLVLSQEYVTLQPNPSLARRWSE